ncbi:hypothetical protein L1887_60170 [Cichorium endivia]|nr:hypothetical protein L1887_60170 [Cichorium endivia]
MSSPSSAFPSSALSSSPPPSLAGAACAVASVWQRHRVAPLRNWPHRHLRQTSLHRQSDTTASPTAWAEQCVSRSRDRNRRGSLDQLSSLFHPSLFRAPSRLVFSPLGPVLAVTSLILLYQHPSLLRLIVTVVCSVLVCVTGRMLLSHARSKAGKLGNLTAQDMRAMRALAAKYDSAAHLETTFVGWRTAGT